MRRYLSLPLFAKIALGAVLGIAAGMALGPHASWLKPVSDIVLQLLRMLATPLIFLSIVHSILSANIQPKQVGRLIWLLGSNSVLAIVIGIGVANLIQPGSHVSLPPPEALPPGAADPWQELLSKIPKNFVDPFSSNDVIGIILVGVALALAVRAIRSPETEDRIQKVVSFIDLGLKVTMQMLRWLFEFVPLAVFAAAARVVGAAGIGPVVSMLWFVGSVVLGLFLMFSVYTLRLRLGSWVRPSQFFKGGFDTFALAFSTASSAAALPVTYECATVKIGVREESASLGIMIGGTFNHDGTALYEAMAALFVSQALGRGLDFPQQVLVVIMAMVASVGAAGIPEAGLVTMLAVFSAVHLPTDYIPLLLPLDWILDRLRTTVNVAGDLAATCILDGKSRTIPVPDG